MSANNFYNILGVPKNATDGELKTAFRNLALKYHPDRNSGDKSAESKFKEINEAYTILSDSKKRRVYDQYGREGVRASASGAGPASQGFGQGFEGFGADFSDVVGDFVENMFGEGLGSRRVRAGRGVDLKYAVEITLDDAYKGVQIPVNFERTEMCRVCGGNGARPGSGLKRCPTCRGLGQVQISAGFFSLAQTCPDCGGHGEVVETPCRECRGSGRVRKKARLNIKVPAGIHDDSTLRIRHAGEAGSRGGASGDLYVQVHIKHHAVFERAGDDLIYHHFISFAQAALGASIEIPSINGPKTTINIPAGTQHGVTFRVAGKGMTRLEGKRRGDIMVKIKVEVPRHLNARQRELFLELAKTFEEEVSPGGENGFFKKVFGKRDTA